MWLNAANSASRSDSGFFGAPGTNTSPRWRGRLVIKPFERSVDPEHDRDSAKLSGTEIGDRLGATLPIQLLVEHADESLRTVSEPVPIHGVHADCGVLVAVRGRRDSSQKRRSSVLWS